MVLLSFWQREIDMFVLVLAAMYAAYWIMRVLGSGTCPPDWSYCVPVVPWWGHAFFAAVLGWDMLLRPLARWWRMRQVLHMRVD